MRFSKIDKKIFLTEFFQEGGSNVAHWVGEVLRESFSSEREKLASKFAEDSLTLYLFVDRDKNERAKLIVKSIESFFSVKIKKIKIIEINTSISSSIKRCINKDEDKMILFDSSIWRWFSMTNNEKTNQVKTELSFVAELDELLAFRKKLTCIIWHRQDWNAKYYRIFQRYETKLKEQEEREKYGHDVVVSPSKNRDKLELFARSTVEGLVKCRNEFICEIEKSHVWTKRDCDFYDNLIKVKEEFLKSGLSKSKFLDSKEANYDTYKRQIELIEYIQKNIESYNFNL